MERAIRSLTEPPVPRDKGIVLPSWEVVMNFAKAVTALDERVAERVEPERSRRSGELWVWARTSRIG